MKNTTECWMCDNDYVDNDIKVRDYCHITGKYRDSVHRACNISLELNHKIYVAFDNLKNYDSHLIIQELGKINLKVNVVPNELEKYISFIINNKLIFIDSFQFPSSSLESFVENLGIDDLKYLTEEFDNNVLDLLKQNAFYSYEYMSDFEKLKEQLPTKGQLYSSLTERKITDKKNERVLNVWNKSEMRTTKDYHHLYLKCDILLLVHVFEKFRYNRMKSYGLYPSLYMGAPGLTWDSMLKMTEIELELVTNSDMYIFFEKGISYVSNRYSKTSNKYLKS